MNDIQLFLSACGTPRDAKNGARAGVISKERQQSCLRDRAALAILARAVRQARKDSGRTWNAVAKAAGIDYTTLKGIEESRRTTVSYKVIHALCCVLDLDESRWIPCGQVEGLR